jgi:hypothetical protein
MGRKKNNDIMIRVGKGRVQRRVLVACLCGIGAV